MSICSWALHQTPLLHSRQRLARLVGGVRRVVTLTQSGLPSRAPHPLAPSATMEGSTEPQKAAAAPSNGDDVVLQYIILRRDLWGEMGWPLGSVVAQGCHASTAALWLSRDTAITQQYCSPENLDHMHKVGEGGCGTQGLGSTVPLSREMCDCLVHTLVEPQHRGPLQVVPRCCRMQLLS